MYGAGDGGAVGAGLDFGRGGGGVELGGEGLGQVGQGDVLDVAGAGDGVYDAGGLVGGQALVGHGGGDGELADAAAEACGLRPGQGADVDCEVVGLDCELHGLAVGDVAPEGVPVFLPGLGGDGVAVALDGEAPCHLGEDDVAGYDGAGVLAPFV